MGRSCKVQISLTFVQAPQGIVGYSTKSLLGLHWFLINVTFFAQCVNSKLGANSYFVTSINTHRKKRAMRQRKKEKELMRKMKPKLEKLRTAKSFCKMGKKSHLFISLDSYKITPQHTPPLENFVWMGAWVSRSVLKQHMCHLDSHEKRCPFGYNETTYQIFFSSQDSS